MRRDKRIQGYFAGISILIMLFAGGCGRENSTKNGVVWIIFVLSDNTRIPEKTFRGVADTWAIEILSEDIGPDGRLTAEQLPRPEHKGLVEVPWYEKSLFPPHLHFALASLPGRMSIRHKTGQHHDPMSEPAAIDTDPHDAAAYHGRGAAHAKKGRYDRAISDYSKAIDIDPQFAKAFYDRGVAYYSTGQHNLAISDYVRAKEINPRLGEQDNLFAEIIRKKWARLREG